MSDDIQQAIKTIFDGEWPSAVCSNCGSLQDCISCFTYTAPIDGTYSIHNSEFKELKAAETMQVCQGKII